MWTRAHTCAVALALMCLCLAVGFDGKLSTATGAQEASLWTELKPGGRSQPSKFPISRIWRHT